MAARSRHRDDRHHFVAWARWANVLMMTIGRRRWILDSSPTGDGELS
jgi:hypothetical protein